MPQLHEEIEGLRSAALPRVGAAETAEELERLRSELLGRGGRLTALLRRIGDADPAERPAIGQLANEVRTELERSIADRLAALKGADLAARLADEALDMTAPGRPPPVGRLHPTLTVMRDMREIFHAFGFEVFEGPEIETDEYNFGLLNMPPDHPARDLWDTFYVAQPGTDLPDPDGTILRTHTSPVQIRAMRALDPPIRVITPGRCFRYEAVSAANDIEFFQIEGLVIDRATHLGDLKGLLEETARVLYGEDTHTRFRPGYYPFTEPSVAFDIGCLVCGGDGCAACKQSGWMTILGAGMVHPNVLRACGIDPEVHQGYAFGMGPDRMTMLRYGISDIRLLWGADRRFLDQFPSGR